jgi:hypothetical protein
MQKLMPERISRTEDRPLAKEDVEVLKTRRNKQLLFLLSGYLPFILFGLYILLMGPGSLNTGRGSGMLRHQMTIDEHTKSNFWTVAPWFIGFLFIMLNIYFAKLYFQTLRPLIKDIRENKKQLLFFRPAKSEMAFFNRYYLSTPLYQNQQIEVSREDFASISDNDELCLEVGPHSNCIFRLCHRDKQINYY